MRARLNCWVVAMLIWLQYHARSYAWVRRSHSFFGLIPHFGVAERVGFRSFRSIEYRPPKGRLWSLDDFFLCFSGTYLVVHYEVVAVRRWESKEQALADLYFANRRGARARS